MKIFSTLSDVTKSLGPVTVTVGNFDGVHCGHQKLLSELVEMASRNGSKSLVVSFSPHPSKLLRPYRDTKLINSFSKLASLLEEIGVAGLVVLNFTEHLAAQSGRDFVVEELSSGLDIRAMVLGYDSSFGADQVSDREKIASWFPAGQTTFKWMDPVLDSQGEVVSSSRIRKLVENGNVIRAKELIGRAFSISGVVIEGEKRGQKLGYPTANLETKAELLPMVGVYATTITTSMGPYPGVTNVGYNPTFNSVKDFKRIESHLFDQSLHLYGQKICIEFLEFIRPELKFTDVDELIEQIEADSIKAREIHRSYAEMG